MLLFKACRERREFFNEKYLDVLRYLNKHKDNKSQFIKLFIIENIVDFAQFNLEVFNQNFCEVFLNFYVNLFNNKPAVQMKSQLMMMLGKFSKLIPREIFYGNVNLILKIARYEIDKNSMSLCLTVFELLADLMKKYSDNVLANISYEDVLINMFKSGFYESHRIFLIELLSKFEENTIDNVKILIVILNIISIIISNRKFYIKESLNYTKSLNLEEVYNNTNLNPNLSVTNSFIYSNSTNNIANDNMETSFNTIRKSSSSISNKKINNKEYLNAARKSIIDYIIGIKNHKYDYEKLMSTMIKNSFLFLKRISHPCFAKDILNFYQIYCLKFLEGNDFLIKENCINLATAPWIPHPNSNIKIDNDIEYMINIILDSYLNLILSEQNDEIKITMISNLDSRYDKYLASNNFFNKLTLILNINDNNLREKVVNVIGRILQENYTTIIIFIKKSILDIFNVLDLSIDLNEKEEAIILLNYFVKYAGSHILDYVELIFSTLIKILKNNSNDILNNSILNIVSELVSNGKNKKNLNEEYYKEIILICIESLKDNSSIFKQEISLKTILSILENSEVKWKIYFEYPELINLLIQILIKENNKNSRYYCLKIFGFIGAMDPDKLEKLWSIHKIENNFINENYEIDEYNNYDDEEIIAHKRQHLIKNNKNNSEFRLNGNIISNKKKIYDFQKLIIDQELDPCTYHAVRCLMNILKDNSLPETRVQVLGILSPLLKSLQDSDHPVIELILPTLLGTIDEFELNYTKNIFDNILIILRNFKNSFKHYIKEVLDVLEKYIHEKEFQNLVFSILIKMLEEFLDEIELYFPHLIPSLISLLNGNMAINSITIQDNIVVNANLKSQSITTKYVFNCFTIMAYKLSNYLSVIIPELIKYLNNSHILNNDYFCKASQRQQKDNVSFLEDYRNKDEEVFNFLENIISLPNFHQYLPKIITALIKYLENNINNNGEKVMNLFMKMFSKLRSDFLIYLPMIIRKSRDLNINITSKFETIKKILDTDEIIEKIENRNCEVSEKPRIKIDKKFNENNYDQNNNISKTRKSQINKELLIKEFNPENCSIEEDWIEWFKSTSKILFEQSPSYALYYCHNVADYYTPLLTELYNYAFVSCWRTLNDIHKQSIKNFLNIALKNEKTPNEILLTILNLSEFVEREENHIDFINFSELGNVADICQAHAKALYYKENDFRNNNDFNTLEQLISLYYELKLPEAAIGILKMAQQNNKIINEDDWYLKLHKWKEALEYYNNNLKSEKNINNTDMLNGKFKCLDGLCDWESLLNLAEEVEENFQNENNELIENMSPIVSKACLNLSEWEKMTYYVEKMENTNSEDVYNINFYRAVANIQEKKYEEAKVFIGKARNIIDDDLKTLLSESYGRAYKLLLENGHLYELEEIISMNENIENSDKSMELKKEQLKIKWDQRLENVEEEIDSYNKILAIRSLVFNLNEDYEHHLDLAKICRKEDKFTTCLHVLNRLNRKLDFNEKSVKIKVELNINKCLYENNKQDQAINNLKKIIDEEINNISDSLKSRVYSYYGLWNIEKNNKNLNEGIVKSISSDLQLATKFDSKNYKAWHNYGLLNYKYFDYLLSTKLELKSSENLIHFASNSLNGFTNSVCIGGKNISKTLQDLLRLIDIWFSMGEKQEIDDLINKAINKIDMDSWLLVIPQLLARVVVIEERIKNSLVKLLKKIGKDHPRALIYPLVVMSKSKSKKRRNAAEIILHEMREKHKILIEESSLIIEELNRCAMLLHEDWGEAIEESAKLYYQSNDINGMIKILMELHDKMRNVPETMSEIHFHQLYSADLSDAENYIKRYIDSKNELDIKQAWDIYQSIFTNIIDISKNVKYLDLESVSPKLYNFKESQICVPGLYKSGYPVIKIRGFEKQLTVLSSKQHPRRLIVLGSDEKEYMFLLKGHEDLRQDERAMQLFGLVNTLLANDYDTADKNLFIKRFPVIPLSHNTGIIGWVPNCDTLYQLIREYRISNKIIEKVEYKIVFTIYPKFETGPFMNKLEVFKYALQNTMGLDLYKILWKKSKNSEAWLDRRTNYSRSLAVMSMVGYILGLGDRHPSNLMLDRNSGKIIHIDFGDCFEVAMKREKHPERVPFRLTRMLIKALEVSGIEGTFRMTCENVMRVLRSNKDSLIAILASFVHDPLISFRLLIPFILKSSRVKKGINQEGKLIILFHFILLIY
jgi:FKBP12-rapamycin complex-associated protein